MCLPDENKTVFFFDIKDEGKEKVVDAFILSPMRERRVNGRFNKATKYKLLQHFQVDWLEEMKVFFLLLSRLRVASFKASSMFSGVMQCLRSYNLFF